MSSSADAGSPAGMSFENGRLQYDFWSKQREALDACESGLYDIVAFLAGYRSGKSVTGARWVISNAARYPGSRWLAMGVDFEKAKSTTYRVLFENLPGERTHILTSSFNGPENSPLVVDYNRNDKRLTFFNDSVIQLGSADNWARYAGDEYSGIWLDEPSHYGDELFDLREVLSTRLSADVGPGCMFWSLTGNGYNSAWQILEKREDAGGDELDDRIEVIRGSVLDNPFVGADKKAKFKRLFEDTGREDQALHGGFAAQEGLVYDVSRGLHVVDRDVFGADLPPIDDTYRVFGYDSGWTNPRVALEIGRTVGDRDLVVLDEFYESRVHVDDAIDWINGAVAELDDVDAPSAGCDPSSPDDIDKMRNEGIDAHPANNDLEIGISEVAERFNPRDPETGEPLSPKLYVCEAAESLVRELYTYKEEQIGATDAVDHGVDALRYGVQIVAGQLDGGSIGLATVSTR